MAPGRASRRALATGVALACGLLCLESSLSFVTPGDGISKACSSSFAGLGVEVKRSSEPRTVMMAKDSLIEFEGNEAKLLRVKPFHQERTHWSGGARQGFSMHRRVVLGLAVAETRNGLIVEQSSSVMSRMRNQVQVDYATMIVRRDKYHRNKKKKMRFETEFKNRIWGREKKRRAKKSFEEAWGYWLRTKGRSKGLDLPVTYGGPKLGHLLDEQLDQASDPKVMMKKMPTKEELASDGKFRLGLQRQGAPSDMLPGQWNTGDANIFKVWKRPLHKTPIDVKKKNGKVARQIVF